MMKITVAFLCALFFCSSYGDDSNQVEYMQDNEPFAQNVTAPDTIPTQATTENAPFVDEAPPYSDELPASAQKNRSSYAQPSTPYPQQQTQGAHTITQAPSENGAQNQMPQKQQQSVTDSTNNIAGKQETDQVASHYQDLSQEHDEEMPEILRTSEQGFDLEAKRKSVIKLVEDGIAYFKQNNLDQSFNAFSHTEQFRRGEMYLFVYDITGNCFAHGQDEHLIWKNLFNMKDDYNIPIVQNIIAAAKADIGWVTYQWRGATKKSYVKEVAKEGQTYIIGAGYYPHSKSDAVVSLVIGAVARFNEVVYKLGHPPEEAFSSFSYPLGRFVQGDLYLYAVDFNGIQTAHGERPGLIGTSALDYQDSNGKYVNKTIISKLKKSTGGVWVEYVSKNAPKVSYAREVVDKTGKHYFIACGYYPTADRSKVVSLVKDGYEFMKKNGVSSAVDAFTDRRNDTYRYGDLYLFVYDTKGKVIANGYNSELVGLNRWNEQDENGVYYIRELIKRAQDGGGWVNYRIKNSFEAAYVEPIDIGLDEYIIGSSLFPISKQETMLLLVRSGAEYLKTRPRVEVLSRFTNPGDNFIRGDLFLTVYDPSGIVLAYGDQFDLIWRNLMNARDDSGKQYVRLIINAVQRGPAKVTYTINGVKRVVYVEQVSNAGFTYIITSGYFL